jgi:sarcosine oxidase
VRTTYEYIVAGCGGIGSAAAYWLSRQAGAQEVLALEQFSLGHDRGGSEDHSRIIRLSYHAPEYTALTPHTYEAWSAVEEESGVQLVFRTGGLDLEPVEDGEPKYIDQYAGALRAAGIPYEELSAREVMERFPQFMLDDNVRALYQDDAGLVDAARANATHVALARARGATILENTPVRSVRVVGGGVEVETDNVTLSGRRLIVAAGAWTNGVLRHVGVELPITCTQEQVTYFKAPNLDEFSPERFPVWIWHGGLQSTFYGVPVYGAPGTKAGQDVGGDVVTADTRTFEPNGRALANLRRFLERRIPGSLGPVLFTKTCLYDMPPDREFVLGALPAIPQISVFVGAGHGFKFASLGGKILAELALYGKTHYPIEAFRVDRPALTDPTYEPAFAM